jgi:PAS domain S-box-containing protein
MDRTRRHLYTLVAINLIIVGLAAAYFGYHQWVQDRIFEKVVHYHTVTNRAAQSGLEELHHLSDALWRQTFVHEEAGVFVSPSHAHTPDHETIAGHVSALAEERKIVLSLQQRFADPQFEEAAELAIRAFEPVLLIGSPDDPTQGHLDDQLEIIEALDLQLQHLLNLHMEARERLAESGDHEGLDDPNILLTVIGLLTGFGLLTGIGVVRSVTAASAERETALQALRQNELRLAHLADGLEAAQRIARIGNWEWDAESGAEWWSDENYRIIGFEPGTVEPSNKIFFKVIHEQDRKRVAQVVEEADTKGTGHTIDFRVVFPDGSERNVREIGEPVFDSQGRHTGQRGTIQDITEQHLAETGLAEAVRRLEAAQRIAKVADWEWDPDSDRLDWPPNMRKVLGLPPSDEPIDNDAFAARLHPDDREVLLERMRRAAEAGEPYSMEYRFVPPGGAIRTIMEYAEPFTPDGSDKVQLRGTIQDITDHRRTETELATAVRGLNKAQRLARVGSWEWDIVNNRDVWSDECYRIHGLEPGSEGLSGTDYLKCVHPEDRESVNAAHERAVIDGKPLNIEFRLRAGDGAERIVQTHGEVTYDEEGRPVRMSGTVQDVTELRRREAELRNSEQRFSLAFQISPGMTAISEIETGNHVAVNDKWVETIGHSREEAVGRTSFELGIWANLEDRARAVSLLEKDGRFRDFEAQYRTREGELRDFLISAEPFPIGDRPHMLTVAYEITERKRAELALQETKERLEEAQRLGQMGSWTWEPEENIELWSDEQYRIFGLAPGSVFLDGFGFLKYVHPDDRDRVEKIEREAAENLTSFSIEYRIVRPDGTERAVAEQGEWIEDDTVGKPQWRGVVQDITERKRIEQELALLNAELEERVEERTAALRAAQEELVKRERLATLGQLTATVSHELRNPLGAIRTSLYVVEKKTAQGDNRMSAAIGRINRSITRCDNIIDELLDFTRVRDLQFQQLRVNKWLIALLEEQPVPESISVHRNLDTDNVRVSADPDRLRRAVINIYENACQAMAPNGTGAGRNAASPSGHSLSISTRQGNNRFEIIIEDTGPGIAEDSLDRIFEPLFSTKNFGAGLGLPIVRQIMEQHGGGVEANNRKGGGAKFILWLPLEPDQGSAEVSGATADSTLQ